MTVFLSMVCVYVQDYSKVNREPSKRFSLIGQYWGLLLLPIHATVMGGEHCGNTPHYFIGALGNVFACNLRAFGL
jgi:hypothetical protein